ncbi:hypothetical protein H2199_006299 [Coniosporium tulheliwenetii]|uniref:Uncharacterized protein n=1 Tax=Coniosporium tulheliwenetii TaxID=3383036 RepID=A0ACC2YXJ7_9PEZI|nr:hypothetical protein H2199_006299 [Cladosporium sp. JES 115]
MQNPMTTVFAARLTETVELEIDPETGMKNYIANSGKGWETSADYISGELRECIAKGRRGRQGDQQAMSDALIHLGGALHTLEDFAAHSNFTELCLNQLGEQDVFAVVGDSCKVTIPSTGQQVAPLVTGTFGALDVLQSILGEADDKAALGTKGELDKLLDNLSVGGSAFQAMYERLKPVIEALSKIPGQDKAEGLLSDLNKVNDVATKAKNEPSAFQPKNNRVDGPSELWDAIEPAFALHDHVAKWLLENDFDIPFISESIETITRYIDNFVYSFLALVIEPSVREMRNAAEAGRKELLEKEKGLLKNDKEPLENDKNLPDNIYNPGSQDSNPSHSVIAKDHFSNYLNPPAGLVATVTTNWTTQQVVHCWDDSSIDCEARIAEILGILHHPAFASATGASFIQRIMYEAVEQWWSRHNEDEKKTFVRNNHKVTEAYFKDKKGGAAVFEGSAPGGIDRPKPGFGLDKLVNEVSEKLETAVQALGEGLKNAGEVVVDTAELVGDAVGEAFSDAGSVINDAASEVGSVIIGAVDAVDDAVDTVATGVVQGANDAVEFVGDAAITVGDGVIDFGKGAVDTVVEVTDTIGDGLNTVGDAIGSVMPWNW